MASIRIATFSGESHATRADGARLRQTIEERWADSEPLTLDFSGIRIASASFFDESFGVLAKEHPLDVLTSRVRVTGIDRSDRGLLNQIVASRAKERETKPAIRPFLSEAGVPTEVLARWAGTFLGLFPDRGGLSASPEMATRMALEKEAADGWILDLGHYQMSLSRDRADTLKAHLDTLGVEYATRSRTRYEREGQRNGRSQPSSKR